MARINKGAPSKVFESLQAEKRNHDEKGDCAVKALAIVTNYPYAVAREALRRAGRKPRHGTSNYQLTMAAKLLGYNVFQIKNFLKELVASYPAPHNTLKSVTTHHPRRFKKQWSSLSNESLLLFTNGHVAAFKSGELHDWSADRALRIKDAWMVKQMPADEFEQVRKTSQWDPDNYTIQVLESSKRKES